MSVLPSLVLLASLSTGATPVHEQTRSHIVAFAAYNEGNIELATAIWQECAQRDVTICQYALGVLYELGDGVERNYRLAADWYARAADRGYAMARNNLGMLYESGLGVTKDLATARDFYQAAAQQGLPSAQYNLALMYYQGLGAPRDLTQASDWMRKAAQQGFASAQFNLGTMYQRGEGVGQDDVAAAQWYISAMQWGASRAENSLRLLLRGKPQLTAADIATVRAAPRRNAGAIAELRPGDKVYSLRKDGSWTAIVLQDERTLGWIDGTALATPQ